MLQAPLPPDPPSEVILVTGRALPDAPAERARHINVVGRHRLRDSPVQGLDSILTQVAGVQMFRRSDATSAHPTSQGVTLRALGGNAASRALLVLDGVPQADPFGGWVNWPAYGPAGLEAAKVVRGGGSTTYGPGALAGVIELASRTEPGFAGAIEKGSRDSLHGHAYFGELIGPGVLTLSAQASRSSGFIPVTKSNRGVIDRAAPYDLASVRGRWVAPLGRAAEIQLAGLAFHDQRERGLPFTANRTRGADLSVRLVGRGRWQWSVLTYAQSRTLRSSFTAVDEARTAAARVALQDSVPSRGLGAGFELRPSIGGGIQLRLGGDARFVTGDSRELFAFADGEPTRRRESGGDSLTAGSFVETAFAHGRLAISAGARLDHWRTSNGTLVESPLGGAPTRYDDFTARGGWQPTARLGAVLAMAPGVDLRAAAYRGWRLPTLNELFRPFRAGPDATAANPRLDPETLTGAELGVRLERARLAFELTAFANRLANVITNVTLGRGPGVFPGVGFVAGDYRQRRNLDRLNVRGLEASAEAQRGPWTLRLGASVTSARIGADREAAMLDGLRPAQTPRVMATAELGWVKGQRAVSLALRHAGSQFEDDLNRYRLAPATTIDAFLAWPIGKRAQLIARGQNLLDELVEAGAAQDGTVERGTPRTLWIGLRLLSP